MDLNEIRRQYRQKKEQENIKSEISQPLQKENVISENKLKTDKNGNPMKTGEPSIVSITESSYLYEKGNNWVEFSCERIDNQSNETTGQLSICCWISEKQRINDEWQNDNYVFINSVDLGGLDNGYGFPDIRHTFKIENNILEIIDKLNENKEEWHFVFTINELYEDGNRYIIHTINGPDENEELSLPISDDSISLYKNNDDQYLAYFNNEEFTGTLFSSDERFEIEFEKAEPIYVWVFHENDEIATEYPINDDEDPTFYDENGNEISEDNFLKKYGNEFEEIIERGFEEIENKVIYEQDSNIKEDYSHEKYMYVFSKIKAIIIDKLGVEPYEVVDKASFINDLGADSLDAVELIMEFEKEFGISIPDDQAENIYTVRDAVAYIANNCNI